MIYGASYAREAYASIVPPPVATAGITDIHKGTTILTTKRETRSIPLTNKGVSTLRSMKNERTVLT